VQERLRVTARKIRILAKKEGLISSWSQSIPDGHQTVFRPYKRTLRLRLRMIPSWKDFFWASHLLPPAAPLILRKVPTSTRFPSLLPLGSRLLLSPNHRGVAPFHYTPSWVRLGMSILDFEYIDFPLVYLMGFFDIREDTPMAKIW